MQRFSIQWSFVCNTANEIIYMQQEQNTWYLLYHQGYSIEDVWHWFLLDFSSICKRFFLFYKSNQLLLITARPFKISKHNPNHYFCSTLPFFQNCLRSFSGFFLIQLVNSSTPLDVSVLLLPVKYILLPSRKSHCLTRFSIIILIQW